MSKPRANRNWAPLDRHSGESVERWLARNNAARKRPWIEEKIARGEWLSTDEFARKHGRPGKALSSVDETVAVLARRKLGPARRAAAPRPKPSARTPVALRLDLAGEVKGLGIGATISAVATLGSALLDPGVDAMGALEATAKAACVSVARGATVRGVEIGLEKLVIVVSESAIKEGAKRVARETVKEGTKQIVKVGVQQTAKAALRGNAIGALAGFGFDQGVDTIRLLRGSIDGREYGKRSAENASSSAGGLGGAVGGAAIGTLICPGVGTVVGGIVGGMAGGLAAMFGMKKVVR